MGDGWLDILVLQKQRKPALVYFFLMAWLRKPLTGNWIHRFRAGSLRIERTEGVWVQTDGELAGGLPLDISLDRASFPLVVPHG
jgi:diacylglycerol kinase family enzyme